MPLAACPPPPPHATPLRRDASFAAAAFAGTGQRVLLPAIENSGDGFGDPARAHEGANPLPILHEVLHSLGAAVGQVVTLCVMEFCDRVRRAAGGGGRRLQGGRAAAQGSEVGDVRRLEHSSRGSKKRAAGLMLGCG